MSESRSAASVVIPARNEGDRIGETVRAAAAIPGVSEVIVVDDGSTDDTSKRAAAAGASQVIRNERGKGKGAAMNRGARSSSGDFLLFLDGDLGASAGEGSRLLDPLLRGAADVTVAAFMKTGNKAGFGLVVGLSRWGARRLTGRTLDHPLSGQRAMRRETFERIGGFAPGYAVETAMNVDLFRAGYRVVEVPTAMSHRATGRNLHGFFHRGRQFFHIAAILLLKALDRPRNPA